MTDPGMEAFCSSWPEDRHTLSKTCMDNVYIFVILQCLRPKQNLAAAFSCLCHRPFHMLYKWQYNSYNGSDNIVTVL